MAGSQGQRASTSDLEYETRVELAVKDLTDGIYKIIKGATKAPQGEQVTKDLGRPNVAVASQVARRTV